MTDARDMDPNVDEHEYEHSDEGSPTAPRTGADEHADNPNPDADGVAPSDADGADPEAPGPTADIVDSDTD